MRPKRAGCDPILAKSDHEIGPARILSNAHGRARRDHVAIWGEGRRALRQRGSSGEVRKAGHGLPRIERQEP